MATGLKRAKDEIVEKTKNQGKTWIRRLTLKDGEKAWFKYMATGEDDDYRLETYSVHKVTSDDGKFDAEYCTYDDEGQCKRCLQSKSSPYFGVWLWVDYVLRKTQNPQLQKNENAKPWKPVKYGEERYYLEEINDVRLWTSGPGNKRYIFNQVLESYESYGTLMDRKYIMERTGAGQTDTTYKIKPTKDTEALTEKQMETYRLLPSITDAASGRKTWPPQSGQAVTENGSTEDLEEFKAPEPELITASPDEIVMDVEDDDGEDEEVLEMEKSDDDGLISKTIDDVMGKLDSKEEESDEPTPLRPGRKKE